MSIKIYGDDLSPFCRIVYTVCNVLNVEYEKVTMKPMFRPAPDQDFIKMNPQNNVPVMLDVDGFAMNESRAIAVYLAQKYDKTGKLFPADIVTQARINNYLAFDLGVLQNAFGPAFGSMLFKGVEELSAENTAMLKKALGFMDGFVKDTGYLAGTEHPTVADYVGMSHFYNIATFHKIFPELDLKEFPNLMKWFEAVKATVPKFDEANNIQVLVDMFVKKTSISL